MNISVNTTVSLLIFKRAILVVLDTITNDR